VKTEVRHLGNGDEIDTQMGREDRQDLIAVELVPAGVDREHPVAVAVEGDAEVEVAGGDRLAEKPEIGCLQ
jgi:hypothetical protein